MGFENEASLVFFGSQKSLCDVADDDGGGGGPHLGTCPRHKDEVVIRLAGLGELPDQRELLKPENQFQAPSVTPLVSVAKIVRETILGNTFNRLKY